MDIKIMDNLKRLVPNLEGKKVLVVGDLMLDEHIWSQVNRISPEAPVPIAEVKAITHVPGGCGNVAANISSLGGIPLLVSLIGKDSSGDKLYKALEKAQVSTRYIISNHERPTILKSRIIAGSQQMVRVDREEKTLLPPALQSKIIASALKLISQCDAVVLSDYGKGALSNEVCRQIISASRKRRKPVLVDPKGRDYKKYQRAYAITPNLHEAEAATGIKITDEVDLKKAGGILLKTTLADIVIITCGKDGMSIFSRDRKPLHIEAVPREVYDITGAGDTVIAALALSLGAGADIEQAAQLANQAASIAVGKIGTQPVYLDELEEALEEKEPSGRKIKSRQEIKKIMTILKRGGRRVVFTNGCFDILHLGHVRYLKEAKKLGDILIVGLNSDSSVRKLKGALRPYVSELERAEILASLECVDYVSIFAELRPDELIKVICPCVHVKGGDYKKDDLPEKDLLEGMGAQVVIIPPVEGRSTSSLIQRILERKK